MRRWIRLIKVAALVVLIVLAVLLTTNVIGRLFVSNETTVANKRLTVGNRFLLAGQDWARYERTLILVLDKGCKFCLHSAPFYKKITDEAVLHQQLGLIAVFPHSVEEGRSYLRSINVNIPHVQQASLSSIGVRGTPAVILIDRDGVVKGLWVGQLSRQFEVVVFKNFLNQFPS
jgi:hypothetical protein